MMDLRQLRYLIAVADELNFTRAARRCHISQPPLSRAIAELEAEIGARLFDRDRHSVALTPAGDSFVADARQALSLLQAGADRANRIARGLSGSVTFGFGGPTAYSLFPELIRRFRKACPDVMPRYRALSFAQQTEALHGGEIDIGIVRLPIFDELIETRLIHREELVVAISRGHPVLARKGALRINDLRSCRFVTYEATRGFNYRADFRALCQMADFEPDITHEAPTTEAVLAIVACGESVSIVPASASRWRVRGVVFRPLASPAGQDTLSTARFAIAWHRNRASAAARQFINLCPITE